MRAVRWLLQVVVVCLGAGCALGPVMEAPSISISTVRFDESTVPEQRFRAALRIQNPNAVELAVEGISYEVEVNGQPFAKGVGKGIVVIPAFGQGVIETEAITTLIGFIRQLREVERVRRPAFAYRVKGKVKLRDHTAPLPFEIRGDTRWATAPTDPTQ